MDKLAAFGLIWVVLLILLLPAIAPIEYASAENGQEAYILTPPNQMQQGDAVQYWDNGTQSFRLSTIRRSTSAGYVVTAPPESGINTTVVPAYAIVGTPITIAGEPMGIPFVGAIVPFVRSAQSLVLVSFLAVSVLIGAIIRERTGTHRRNVLRVRHVMLPILAVVILSTLAITPIAASTYQIGYEPGTETEVPTDDEWTEQRFTVRYRQPLFTHLIVETPTEDLVRWQQGKRVLRADIRVPTVGSYTTSLSMFPYLAVLPRSIIQQLHAIHPVVAIVGTTVVVSGPLAAIYGLFIDGTKPAPRIFQSLID